MSDTDRSTELVALSPAQLHVGAVLRFSLRDERGRVLLAKGLRIADLKALQALQSRPSVFVAYEESDEAVKVLMHGFSEASRRDAPLKDLDRFINLKAPTADAAPTPTSVFEAWGEVELRLRSVLNGLAMGGEAASDALKRLDQLADTPRDSLLNRDRDAALFLLINRAVTSYTGYSVMHSLLTAAVVQLLVTPLKLPANEEASVLRAAFTMNVAMTSLQDALAEQKHRPTTAQQARIEKHPAEGVRLLQAAGVRDPLWLGVVLKHHDELPVGVPLAQMNPVDRLARVLQVVDRYTAAMSPRGSRAGRDAKDAARSAIVQAGAAGHDEVGLALMMLLGLHPAGTFVKLANGETAVVLRKGGKANEPVVASVLNRRDEPISEPRLHNTARPDVAVVQGVSGASVRVRINPAVMLKLLAASRQRV